ncbi:MAG: hypothetical protein ACLR8Y_18235 [Alistipes indistinctus]
MMRSLNWQEVFAKLTAALHSEGVLVTYSAKGMVKDISVRPV